MTISSQGQHQGRYEQKIFIKEIADNFKVKPDDVLRLLAEHPVVSAIVSSVKLSNKLFEGKSEYRTYTYQRKFLEKFIKIR